SDGQEGLVPVLSSKILITETEAITLDPEESYIFSMKEWRGRATRDVLNVTMEYTAHPAWVAIQSLPYLADYPHECVEQMVNKVFANEVGALILNAIPGIKQVMQQWNAPDSKSLLSNLEKNQELKSILIEETPWLRDALSETEQRKSIALLLDENNLSNQSNAYLQKIIASQSSSGGFPWFAGGRDNTYITQYVVESMARMIEMGIDRVNDNRINVMVDRAINFMDEELQYRYEQLKERVNRSGGNLDDDHISSIDIHYLYVRSFYPELQVKNEAIEAHDYYVDQATKYWMNKSDLGKSLIGIVSHRSGEHNVRDIILQSFSERAIKDDLGMYWKSVSGYYWYQQPIESHTAITRLFQEVGYDDKALNEMKLWLLNQKRTQSWSSTKSTADAIHAMLLPSGQSESWLSNVQEPTIKLNDSVLKLSAEAGSGYVKEKWVGGNTSDVETISITNHNKSVGWGGVYIQYMEEINQVESSGDQDFTVEKEVFIESIDGQHTELKSLEDYTPKVGDILVNRLVIRTNRDLEYVHLKDMRGAGTEPLNVLSGYRWKGGLGYYESTRDAATHFFIDYLSKGNYVFEYKTRVSHSGAFDNGIATIQCMYAPEFSSHSSSQLLEIK
ncbi:MAG: alpha-2-macroglobulin, partial [Saprospiraceae bacterium]|nr:alpha-2-macroglobulin [Saprospiraceae bacterium]